MQPLPIERLLFTDIRRLRRVIMAIRLLRLQDMAATRHRHFPITLLARRLPMRRRPIPRHHSHSEDLCRPSAGADDFQQATIHEVLPARRRRPMATAPCRRSPIHPTDRRRPCRRLPRIVMPRKQRRCQRLAIAAAAILLFQHHNPIPTMSHSPMARRTLHPRCKP